MVVIRYRNSRREELLCVVRTFERAVLHHLSQHPAVQTETLCYHRIQQHHSLYNRYSLFRSEENTVILNPVKRMQNDQAVVKLEFVCRAVEIESQVVVNPETQAQDNLRQHLQLAYSCTAYYSNAKLSKAKSPTETKRLMLFCIKPVTQVLAFGGQYYCIRKDEKMMVQEKNFNGCKI